MEKERISKTEAIKRAEKDGALTLVAAYVALFGALPSDLPRIAKHDFADVIELSDEVQEHFLGGGSIRYNAHGVLNLLRYLSNNVIDVIKDESGHEVWKASIPDVGECNISFDYHLSKILDVFYKTIENGYVELSLNVNQKRYKYVFVAEDGQIKVFDGNGEVVSPQDLYRMYDLSTDVALMRIRSINNNITGTLKKEIGEYGQGNIMYFGTPYELGKEKPSPIRKEGDVTSLQHFINMLDRVNRVGFIGEVGRMKESDGVLSRLSWDAMNKCLALLKNEEGGNKVAIAMVSSLESGSGIKGSIESQDNNISSIWEYIVINNTLISKFFKKKLQHLVRLRYGLFFDKMQMFLVKDGDGKYRIIYVFTGVRK